MTNEAALGYMLLASRELFNEGVLTEFELHELQHALKYVMDIYTEEEAEKALKRGW